MARSSGLVQKTGLVELVDDDRATLLGLLLEAADLLQENEHQGGSQAVSRAHLLARWRRRGLSPDFPEELHSDGPNRRS